MSETPRAPKRTSSETHTLLLKLKTLLIQQGRAMILNEIAENIGVTPVEAIRLLNQIGATKERQGMYTYSATDIDHAFAMAAAVRVVDEVALAELKRFKKYWDAWQKSDDSDEKYQLKGDYHDAAVSLAFTLLPLLDDEQK